MTVTYIVIDHGGGWQTYSFHLASYSVPSGAVVAQGQQIGITGSTGNSSGAHIHYQSYLTSDNGCGVGGGNFRTWGSDIRVRADAYVTSRRVP